ncbi:hypothetical protein [Altericista sp. CCNU0014]|uniref:hypothetical protein n=1 Tax=Altericista sp. CCNU0014 TaxID=3082949 RepID=UPI00384D5EB2
MCLYNTQSANTASNFKIFKYWSDRPNPSEAWVMRSPLVCLRTAIAETKLKIG